MVVFNPTKAREWAVCMVSATCMVLYGYDASVFNAVQGSKLWLAYFNEPTATQIGLINSIYIVGNIVAGFFISPFVSNKFGRRVAIFIGSFLVIIATCVQTWAPRGHLNAFLGGRFIVGLGQGMALPVGSVYISEIARSSVRGRVLSFWQLFYSVGSFIAFWIASPRWYVSKGKLEHARRSLRLVRETEAEVEAELLEMREAIEYEQRELSGSGLQVYKTLWMDKSLRWRFFLMLVINAGQQLTGQGSLNSYSTIIYKRVFKSAQTISLINALNASMGILFTLNCFFLVDRMGRKWLLCVGAIGQACCMVIVALVETQSPTTSTGATTRPVAISIVFLLFLFILFYKPSWGATVWVITSEVFSMNVRAHAVGMASQTQNIANIIVNQFFPQFLDNCGFYAFFLFAGINVGLFLFVFFLVPETRGVKLEEMDVLFGGKNHINEGADLVTGEASEKAEEDGSEKGVVATIETVKHSV
ncbi:hypothetical protein RQP46_006719 [Phenoliferia psychrophenolica]